MSYYLKRQVPNFIKKLRLHKIQKLQQGIAQENLLSLIGSEVEVLVDEFDENDGFYVGHTNFLSKAVDFNIKMLDNRLSIGDFVKVKITDFDGENLRGDVL